MITTTFESFGAVGDGITDDLTAVMNALAAVDTAGGGTIVCANANYYCSAQPSITTAHKISVIGMGKRLTTMIFDNALGGLKITYTNENFPPNVKGISFKVRGLGIGTGLSIIGPVPALSTLIGSTLEDLEFSGENMESQCWQTCLYLYQNWYPSISDVYMKGQTTITVPMANTYGINMDTCDVVNIEDVHGFHMDTAIYQSGPNQGESFKMGHSVFVGCGKGVVFTGNSGSDSGGDISGCHFNCYQIGISMTNRMLSTIHDNLLFKTGGSADWVGILLNNSSGNSIHDNRHLGCPTATGHTTGVELVGNSNNNDIHNEFGNLFNASDYVVALLGSSDYNTVNQIRGKGNAHPFITASSGTHNAIGTNYQS